MRGEMDEFAKAASLSPEIVVSALPHKIFKGSSLKKKLETPLPLKSD